MSPTPSDANRPAAPSPLRLNAAAAPDADRHHAAAADADAAPGGIEGKLDDQDLAVRAASMLPAQLLQPGEIIILLLKPHPLYIVLAPLKTLVVLLLLTILGVRLARESGSYDTSQTIMIVGVALIVLRLFWQFLEWLSRVYVLTDQRVVSIAGVLRVRVFETQLNNVSHSELLFSLRERFFALGTLGFYTAGSAIAEAYWVMVAAPLDVHAKVVETLKRYRR